MKLTGKLTEKGGHGLILQVVGPNRASPCHLGAVERHGEEEAQRCNRAVDARRTHAGLRLSQFAQPSMRPANFLSHDMIYAMAIAAVHRFFPKGVACMQQLPLI